MFEQINKDNQVFNINLDFTKVELKSDLLGTF